MKRNIQPQISLLQRSGWITILVILILAVWGGISLFDYYKYEQTNDAQVQEYVNPVIARAGGFIVAVKFEENQNVKRATHF